MAVLTNDEKTAIINQHKRNVEYSRFNVEMSIVEENAVSEPNQATINDLNSQIAELDLKLAALDAQLASL